MTEGFNIIGISVITTNKNQQSAQDIGNLWAKFHSEKIFDSIPNKISNEIFSVYTDYKSNYTDEYTTIIGVPVSTLQSIPKGLIGRKFEAEKFQKYVAKGEMPQAVVNTWISIWKQDETLNRKYSYDFEVYGNKCQNGANSEVEIYVAVK